MYKKSLKIPKGQSETVYRRITDNTMAKRKNSKHNLMKKWGKMEKEIKKYCKIQSPRPIGVPRDYFMVDRFWVTWPNKWNY
jgi:hypothetical protein